MQSALPIVSQLLIFLTKLLSSIILRTDYAKDIVTASGRPSGMAHTITEMPMMMAFNTFDSQPSQPPLIPTYTILPTIAATVAIAEIIPN